MVVRANTEVAKLARGVGKTEGIVAVRAQHNAYAMRRSHGGFVAPTWKKMFTDLWPQLINGLEGIGYVEGKHFVMGKRGDKRWDQPYRRPRDWSHTMHWNCGSARSFLSQYNSTIGNGQSFDDLIVEEGKMIDSEHFYSNTLPAMRGNLEHFGGMSEHHSLLIVSDAATTKAGKWFEAYKKQMDAEVITMILQAAYRQQKLFMTIRAGGLSESTVERYTQEINQLEKDLNELRKNAVYYHEASILDNIEVYGWENFLRKERTMNPYLFRSSLLNESIDTVEGAWYHNLDDRRHCYIPKVTSWTEAKGYDRERMSAQDSRRDAEIISTLPIDIALDYGGNFNCVAIGQQFVDQYRIDNGFHGTHPEVLGDVLMKVVNYYMHHTAKSINYFFDDTAKDKHGSTRFNYYDIVVSTFTDHGWDVNPVYIGQTPDPPLRYELTVHLLTQDPAPVKWNPDNCSDMLTAMRLTQIREGPRGMAKDKRPEGRSLEEQVHAPHYGDAVDTLLWGRFQIMDQRSDMPSFSIPQ